MNKEVIFEEKILNILGSGCFEIIFMDKIPYMATGSTPFHGSSNVIYVGSDMTTVHGNINKETRDKMVKAIREILVESLTNN